MWVLFTPTHQTAHLSRLEPLVVVAYLKLQNIAIAPTLILMVFAHSQGPFRRTGANLKYSDKSTWHDAPK